MKKLLITLTLSFILFFSYAQSVIYDPGANAAKTISFAVTKAKTDKKFVFLQIGGNWCPWCVKFHDNYLSDPEISAAMGKGFIFALVNYSNENKNLSVLKSLEYPQRFGFPVFVILDSTGKRIHTQNSVYLEEGSGYSKKKILEFLKQWSPEAINPDLYK